MIMIDPWPYLSSVLPCNASEALNSESPKRAQHCPPPMDQLTLTEPLQPEHLRVRLQRRRIEVRRFDPGPDHITRQILGQVLVQPVVVKLQVLHRLPQPQWVEPAVSDQRAIEPFGTLGTGEPHEPVGLRLFRDLFWRWWRWLLAEAKEGLELSKARARVLELGTEEMWRQGSCGGGHGWSGVKWIVIKQWDMGCGAEGEWVG